MSEFSPAAQRLADNRLAVYRSILARQREAIDVGGEILITRAPELRGYAYAHGLTINEAIDRLVCSGLSHDPRLYTNPRGNEK